MPRSTRVFNSPRPLQGRLHFGERIPVVGSLRSLDHRLPYEPPPVAYSYFSRAEWKARHSVTSRALLPRGFCGGEGADRRMRGRSRVYVISACGLISHIWNAPPHPASPPSAPAKTAGGEGLSTLRTWRSVEAHREKCGRVMRHGILPPPLHFAKHRGGGTRAWPAGGTPALQTKRPGVAAGPFVGLRGLVIRTECSPRSGRRADRRTTSGTVLLPGTRPHRSDPWHSTSSLWSGCTCRSSRCGSRSCIPSAY